MPVAVQRVREVRPDHPERDSSAPSSGPRLVTSLHSGRGALLPLRLLLLLGTCAAVAVVGIVGDPVLRYGLILSVTYAFAILGSNLITSTLGEITLSQGAFMAVGAYATVELLGRGWSLVPSLVAATALSAVAGTVLAIPAVRLEGIFTALVTFALAFAVPDLIVEFDAVTGGQAGRLVPFDQTLFGSVVGASDGAWIVVLTAMFAAAGVLFLLFVHSGWGRRAITVGEGGPAGECFGLSARTYEVTIWGVAAGAAGLAGSLYAFVIGYLTPEVFPIMLSILVLVGTVVGGSRSALGALLGGLMIGAVPPQLQSLIPAQATGILFGGVLLAMLLAGRGGVAGWLEAAAVWLSTRVRRRRPAVDVARGGVR